MDQFRPGFVEYPERAAAVGAEGAFGGEFALVGGAAIRYGVVLSRLKVRAMLRT